METIKIDPTELNEETYVVYCKLYLIERIFEVIPSTSLVQYRHVSKLINSINPILFNDLNTETGKLILLNKIYSTFKSGTNEDLYRPFLYEKISHIAQYDPKLHKKDDE